VARPTGELADQVLHLGVELHKARCLRPQTVLEPRLGVHLHLQQHHRLLGCAHFCRARPERAIEAMVCRLGLWRLKAVEGIARRIRPKGLKIPGDPASGAGAAERAALASFQPPSA
jgi:hypothetical protein